MEHKFIPLEPDTDINKLFYKYFVNNYRKGYVQVGEKKVILPELYETVADKIENFDVRDTDVWIVTYPKSGTTWAQEMMWMILNDLDFEGAKSPMTDRFTYLEGDIYFDLGSILEKYPGISIPPSFGDTINTAITDSRNPRLIKTHLPWCMLPKALREGTTEAKIVYVARDPKDTCISWYHFCKMVENYQGSLEDFCELFMANKLLFTPYWNLLDMWKRKDSENILFLRYEDMKKDLISVIRKTSDFLINKQLTDEQLTSLADHLSFNKMKDNPWVNYEQIFTLHQIVLFGTVNPNEKFMRVGKTGSHKDEMSAELIKKFDKWIEENIKDTGYNI